MQIESYDLALDVDFLHSHVKGDVDIKVRNSTDPLAIDAVDLNVVRVTVNGAAPDKVERTKDRVLVHGFPSRTAVISIRFTKQVSDKAIFGLYKSRFGKEHLLVTDLEPAQARTVFPCIDDPSHKAVFRLSVVAQKDLSVIANMPVAKVEDVSGSRRKHTFVPTPRMSTYLLFMGIGKFEESEMKAGRTTVIAASRPGLSKESRFALEASTAVLKKYEEYFGIPYPLKKLHLVALPEYHTGAMENWGAITSREAFVLLGKGASTSDFRSAAHVLAHEIAHQWFGDLVTMKWWDDLWLNESFATFMDYRLMEELHPDWDSMGEFLRLNTFRSMNSDALSETHPIEARVRTVSEIEGIFDDISYGKGASVLRMLESYIGEDVFRAGVSDYLRSFSFSNARGEDLWKSLERASGMPVSSVARAWITKAGFPLVRVQRARNSVKLSQARFRLTTRGSQETWPIPFAMAVGGKTKELLLDRRKTTVPCDDSEDVLANPGRKGFYSVLYDTPIYNRLVSRFPTLSPRDRAGIMNDLYLLMKAGIAEPSLYFKFVSASRGLTDTLTSQLVTEQLSSLRAIAGEVALVRSACTRFYESQIGKIGLTVKRGEDGRTTEAREMISAHLARTSLKFAKTLYPEFDRMESVDPSLRAAVAISFAMVKEMDAVPRLTRLIKRTSNEIERARFYAAMAVIPDRRSVETSLELTISGEVSRSDSAYPLGYLSLNPGARSTLWKWIERRYDTLWEIYGGSQQFYIYMNAVIPRCGVEDEAAVHRFISGKRFEDGKTTYRRTFEQLKANVALRKRLASR